MKTGTQGKCQKDKMLSEPTDKTTALSLSALPANKHETDSFKHDHTKQTMGEFILSVAVESPGFQAILMQRELSFLPFFCGKRKVGKPARHGAQKNGLPCEILYHNSTTH